MGWWWVVVGYKHPVLRTPLYFDFAQYKLWRGIAHVDGLWMVVVGCGGVVVFFLVHAVGKA